MGDIDVPRQRREVLRKALTGGLSVGAAASLAGCNGDTPGTDTDLPGSATDTTRIRRSIGSLQQSDPDNIIPTFKRAVKKMRNLPEDDPRNWDNQVAIHGVQDPNFAPGFGDFTECPHGNWLFLPWHRLYLTYFEEICRDVTNSDHFALPFWNWARNHNFPDVFGQNHGTVTNASGDNPLYHGNRRVSPGDDITDRQGGAFGTSWGPGVLESQVLSDPNFQRAVGGGGGSPKGSGDGQLERYHNRIHGWVGGDMGRANSPNDPVFWTHHCFVDCVWWEWNARRGHSNTNDSDWVDGIEIGPNNNDPAFDSAPSLPPSAWPSGTMTPRKNALDRDHDFVDSGKNGITGGAATSLATLLMPLFTFHYADEGKGSTPQATASADVRTDTATDELERHLEEGANVQLETERQFPIAEELVVPMEEPISVKGEVPFEEIRPIFRGEQEGELLLRATGVVPPERPDQIAFVFVNRPDVFEEPTVNDPGFAGFLDFFTTFGHHDNLHKPLKLNRPLRRLDQEGLLDDDEPLSVQILSLPYEIGDFEGIEESYEEHTFSIGQLDLANTVHRVLDEDQ